VAGIPWADSYLGQLRALAGDRTLLFIGARGVIRDHGGRILLIKRADNGFWAMPGGAMELGESIGQCAIRETFEETGLAATEATPFALYTGPDYTYTNVFGDRYQLFLVAFLLTEWTGELLPDRRRPRTPRSSTPNAGRSRCPARRWRAWPTSRRMNAPEAWCSSRATGWPARPSTRR
jgi:ADP-ribose pyrophosphatase YjhB (NUDIX family)